MKPVSTLILAFLLGFSLPAALGEDIFNDEWTCYSSNNYKGGKKMMSPGDYDNCDNWNYYSWKTNCCVKFYYYYKDGKKGEKVLCGDVRDLRYEMKKWGNLKYGYQGGWKNIYKATFYCEGNDNYANNGSQKNNNNNNHGNYQEILRKGHCVVWQYRNFGQNYEGYMPGKKYYPKDLKYKFWSLECPDNYEVYWVYRSKYGKDEEYTCAGKISDLKSHFSRWNVQNKNDGWNYVKYFEIRKKGSGGNNHSANNKGGDYNDLLRKGHCVVWQDRNFGQNYEGYLPGRKYYPKDLKYKFWSLECPNNYEVYWVYKSKYGKDEEYTCNGKVSDLRSHFSRWNIQNKNNAWDYVKYFEIRKIGTGAANTGKYDDYKNQNWYNKYRNGGYIVFTQYQYYDGRYAGKAPGDYDYKKLGFYPQSIFIPNSSIYLVLEYRGRDGKSKSETLKESVVDLGKYLYEKGVHHDYEKNPYKAITRLAVIRQ